MRRRASHARGGQGGIGGRERPESRSEPGDLAGGETGAGKSAERDRPESVVRPSGVGRVGQLVGKWIEDWTGGEVLPAGGTSRVKG